MKFCDHTCKHARWPEKEGLDGSGSCRTFQAVFCEKRQVTVHKNAACPEKEGKPDDHHQSLAEDPDRFDRSRQKRQ